MRTVPATAFHGSESAPTMPVATEMSTTGS
jgi:hypothetical protein